MTGASGADYTLRLFECCLQSNVQVQFITSQPGQIVVGMETELKLTGSPQKMRAAVCRVFRRRPGTDQRLLQGPVDRAAGQRFVGGRRHGGLSLQHGQPRVDRGRQQRQFDPSRRRRRDQGTEER